MKKIIALAALLTATHAMGQDSSTTLNEVIVTSNKYSVKTTETGKVVTVITRQDIERAGSRDLSQLITEQGGMYINGANSNPGKDKSIYLRGARIDHVLITIDGVPVYDASGIGSNFDIRNLSIDAVERIEILKGSQSTLYGSDAIGGVINIITKKGTAKNSLTGGGHYGSYNTFRAHAGVNGVKGKFDYQAGYSFLDTDGFSEAKKPENNPGAFDKDGYRQSAANLTLGVAPAKGVRIQPFLRYVKNKGELDQNAFTDETDYTYEGENLQAGILNEIKTGAGKWHLQYQYNSTERTYLDDSTGSRNGFFKYNWADYHATEHFAETFLVYPFGKIRLTAGVDLRASSTQQSSINDFGTSALGSDSARQNQVGVYTSLHYVQKGLSLEGGGRFNRHSEYGNNFAFNINPSYLIRQQLKVFANISTGYRTPSLYQLFAPFYGNRNLQPEESLNLEGGLQFLTKDQNLSVRASVYNRRVEDVIFFFFDPATFELRYINQDLQKDHGLEVEAKANPHSRIRLTAQYNYVDGAITTKTSGKDTTYFNLIRRPQHSFSLFAGSTFCKNGYVQAQVQSIGRRKDIYFDPALFTSKEVDLKAYVLVNLYAEYALRGKKLKLFADLRNITDAEYEELYGYNTAGFNLYGGFRFQL